MSEKFSALKSGDRMDYWGTKNPMCPHCGHEVSVQDNELWRLYEEGEHDEVECPSCEQTFTVSTSVSYSFSTDEQEEDDA